MAKYRVADNRGCTELIFSYIESRNFDFEENIVTCQTSDVSQLGVPMRDVWLSIEWRIIESLLKLPSGIIRTRSMIYAKFL